MSSPVESTEHMYARVLASPVPTNLPNNTLRPRPARGTSMEANSNGTRTASAMKDENPLHLLIEAERRCFITGSRTCALEAVHLLSAIRHPEEGQTQEGFSRAKGHIENWLTHIGFNRGAEFKIDSLCNLILLTSDLARHLDQYSTIALTPSYGHLALLRNRLERDNLIWDQASLKQPNAPRPMTDSVYDTTSLNWSMLVLHQEDFLPEGQPLPVLLPQHRAGPPTSAKHWGISRLEHQPEFGFPALVLKSDSGNAGSLPLRTRTPLSLFAVIVNLHGKVSACAPERTAGILPLLEQLVELIFHRPPGLTLAEETINAINISLTGAVPPNPRMPGTEASSEHAKQSAEDSSGGENGENDRASAAEATWAASQSENRDDPTGASDTDDDEEDAGDDSFVPGLTMPEYQTLLHRVGSPSDASARDRAADVGLLFFGTQPYERPPLNPLRAPAAETSRDV